MNEQQNQLVNACAAQLDEGTLTSQKLRDAFEAVVENCNRRQDLLYLQAAETGLDCFLVGFRMVRDGKFVEEPEREEDWPYNSVLDAINDGWRIISFPNMALSLDENRTYGLGYEYILEKWH
ncbi:MAG: hypothetical protein MK179_15405 [Pirellulaceae bacterium]|nr:hypothetical protein [Pirellulaceae bacterium]